MWENADRGEPEFRANGWKLAVKTDDQGVRMLVCRDGLVASSVRLWLTNSRLPPCSERYLRGDALHLSFPDTAAEPIALDLVLTAIEADQEQLILESVISLRTSLLDSHPTVELQLGAGHPLHPRWGDRPWSQVNDSGSALWFQPRPALPSEGPRVATSVFCDDRDRVSLDGAALAEQGNLRFFGDFLEKGVIRKVQPWWVWSNGTVAPQRAEQIAHKLAARPLPLAS